MCHVNTIYPSISYLMLTGEANITDLLMKAIENKNQRYQEWIQLRAPEKD